MTSAVSQWIASCEGLRLKPYKDTMGNLTIGYGHNLSSRGITIDMANLLLEYDINNAQHDLQLNLPWALNLDPVRRDCYIHLCFWMGIGALLGFHKMNWAAQNEDWDTAAQELLNSQLHSDIPKRCEDIANRLKIGELP